MTIKTDPPAEKHSFAREFWRRNQVILLILPLLMAFMVGLYIVLRAGDPRIGLEGFGDLFGYALNGVRALVVIVVSWWFKNIALFDIHKRTELALFERMRDGAKPESDHAYRILIKDRVEWAFLLSLFTYLFTR